MPNQAFKSEYDRHKSQRTQAEIHSAYFEAMILAAIAQCDVIRDHARTLPSAKTKRRRETLEEEIEGGVGDVRDFLQNLAVIHGFKLSFEEDSLEETFFRM